MKVLIHFDNQIELILKLLINNTAGTLWFSIFSRHGSDDPGKFLSQIITSFQKEEEI
jgi:hypothetical protein